MHIEEHLTETINYFREDNAISEDLQINLASTQDFIKKIEVKESSESHSVASQFLKREAPVFYDYDYDYDYEVPLSIEASRTHRMSFESQEISIDNSKNNEGTSRHDEGEDE